MATIFTPSNRLIKLLLHCFDLPQPDCDAVWYNQLSQTERARLSFLFNFEISWESVTSANQVLFDRPFLFKVLFFFQMHLFYFTQDALLFPLYTSMFSPDQSFTCLLCPFSLSIFFFATHVFWLPLAGWLVFTLLRSSSIAVLWNTI